MSENLRCKANVCETDFYVLRIFTARWDASKINNKFALISNFLYLHPWAFLIYAQYLMKCKILLYDERREVPVFCKAEEYDNVKNQFYIQEAPPWRSELYGAFRKRNLVSISKCWTWLSNGTCRIVHCFPILHTNWIVACEVSVFQGLVGWYKKYHILNVSENLSIEWSFLYCLHWAL